MSFLFLIPFVLTVICGELQGQGEEGFEEGATVYIENVEERAVITVNDNGDVTTEPYEEGSEYQLWTMHTHPNDPDSIIFSQAVVPYNEVSGFEQPASLFPKPFTIRYRGSDGSVGIWQIQIRKRWCLSARGISARLTIFDCEDFSVPWSQLWIIHQVES